MRHSRVKRRTNTPASAFIRTFECPKLAERCGASSCWHTNVMPWPPLPNRIEIRPANRQNPPTIIANEAYKCLAPRLETNDYRMELSCEKHANSLCSRDIPAVLTGISCTLLPIRVRHNAPRSWLPIPHQPDTMNDARPLRPILKSHRKKHSSQDFKRILLKTHGKEVDER